MLHHSAFIVQVPDVSGAVATPEVAWRALLPLIILGVGAVLLLMGAVLLTPLGHTILQVHNPTYASPCS